VKPIRCSARILNRRNILLLASPLAAQDQEIQTVIQSQMEAFQARDVGEAFSFASPMIKGMFGTPENFGMMVENGYPMVWNNDEVRYLELREVAGRLWQRVMIRDAAGTVHMLDYQMIQTDDGWQINGVQLLPAPDTGV